MHLEARVAPEQGSPPPRRDRSPPVQTRILDTATLRACVPARPPASSKAEAELDQVPVPSYPRCWKLFRGSLSKAPPTPLATSSIHPTLPHNFHDTRNQRATFFSPAPDPYCSINSLYSLAPFFATITRQSAHAPRHAHATYALTASLALPWQTGDLTAAEAAAEGVTSAAAEEEEEVVEGAEVEGAVAAAATTTSATTSTAARAPASRGLRRRTSSTCPSTATSRSPSSSTAAERVCLSQYLLCPPSPSNPNHAAARAGQLHRWRG